MNLIRNLYLILNLKRPQRLIKGLINFPIKKIKRFMQMIVLIVKVKYFPNNCTIESLLSFIFSPRNEVIKPNQVRSEIKRLMEILQKSKPKILLEIGTYNGGTLFLFSRVVAKAAIIISVDLFKGGYGYSERKTPLIRKLVLPHQKLFLIRADSHKTSTLHQIRKILEEKQLDFLFLDGDHSYEGVKQDFKMYNPLVGDNGIIAFHDILIHPPQAKVFVNILWEEIKENFKYTEIIEDFNQEWAGIGVLTNLLNKKN